SRHRRSLGRRITPMARRPLEDVVIRDDLRPGDLGRVITQHARVYAREFGFDHTFEGYVAATLGEFGLQARPDRDRLWLADDSGDLLGSVGIVGRNTGAAQL